MNVCMICGEESSELTEIEVTNDNGEVIPVTINGEEHDSICVCPDCLSDLFSWMEK